MRRTKVVETAANFYPRPPWGGRLWQTKRRCPAGTFLSTPSVGRATDIAINAGKSTQYFYPRPPWGGRLLHAVDELRLLIISIHALRGEGDAIFTPS